MPVVILLGGVGLTLLLSYLTTRRQRAIAARLDQLSSLPAIVESATPSAQSTLLPTLRSWLTARAVTERVQRDLDGAGLALKAEEFLMIVGTSTAFLAIAAALTLHDPWIALGSGLVGYIGPWRIVRYARHQRKLRLEVQLADALTLMASALRSGHTAIQSMGVTVQQLPPPIAEEFARVIFNVNIGVPIAEALSQMVRRVQSYEYDIMVSAITIQLEVGGSITELLDNISDTIRDRIALRDEMRALTAQGRLSGLLLSAMPVGLFLITWLINRPYMELLVTDPVGWNILRGAVFMECVGWLAIRKILNVRV